MKKKVLLLINQLHGGGAERTVSNLSLALDEEFDVYISIYNDIDKPTYPYSGTMIPIKLPYNTHAASNGIASRIIRFLVLIYKVRKVKRDNEIEVCISFMEASNIVNIFSKRRSEKIILSVRTILSEEMRDVKRMRILKILIRKIYNKADAIVCPSVGISQDLTKNFAVNNSRVSVINNFIDLAKIKEMSGEPLEKRFYEELFASPVVINVGRLSNPKGQVYLLRAFQKLRGIRPDAKLVLIGDGILKTGLIQEANVLGLKIFDEALFEKGETGHGSVIEFDVFFLTTKSNPFKFLVHSAVFVSTSLYEGFPNVLIEAMACGLPVISGDCISGPREILLEGGKEGKHLVFPVYGDYGILMEDIAGEDRSRHFDPYIWAENISQLMNNPLNTVYRGRSQQRVLDFDKYAIIGKWVKLINQEVKEVSDRKVAG